MLPRVLETEVMDSALEAADYDAMDHAGVNRLFVADFLQRYRGDGPVLDVGAGTAQIPIELCRQHATVRVVAVDAAASMIELARRNIATAGLGHRIEPRRVDAKRLPDADGSYPAVMSNSIVHHIPEPRIALAEMVRVVVSGGVLFVRDLLRPESDEEVTALVKLYAGDCNSHQRKLFDDSLRAALSLGEIRACVAELGFAPQAVQQTSDRHWTWSARRGH